MSTDVTNEQLISAMTSNREAVLGRITSLETKIDKYSDLHHGLSSRLLLAESKISSNEKDINDNWVVTRKLDSRITKWGGAITATIFAFGILLKFVNV